MIMRNYFADLLDKFVSKHYFIKSVIEFYNIKRNFKNIRQILVLILSPEFQCFLSKTLSGAIQIRIYRSI